MKIKQIKRFISLILSTIMIFNIIAMLPNTVFANDISFISPFAAAKNILLYIDLDGDVWQASTNTKPEKVEGISNAIAVYTTGFSHAVITTSSDVFVWGDNTYGQLGLGNKKEIDKPQKLSIPFETIIDIAMGERHSLFLTSNGSVYASGANDKGQLGIGLSHDKLSLVEINDRVLPCILSPVKVTGIVNARTIRTDESTSFAVLKDGSAYGWGANEHGRAGRNGYSVNFERPDGTIVGESYTLVYAPRLICDSLGFPVTGIVDIIAGPYILLNTGDIYSPVVNRVLFNVKDIAWNNKSIILNNLRLYSSHGNYYIVNETGETWMWTVPFEVTSEAVKASLRRVRYRGNMLQTASIGEDILWGINSKEGIILSFSHISEQESEWVVRSFKTSPAEYKFIPIEPNTVVSFEKTKPITVMYNGKEIDKSLYQVLLLDGKDRAISTINADSDLVRKGLQNYKIQVELINSARILYAVDKVEESDDNIQITLKLAESVSKVNISVRDEKTKSPIANAGIYATQIIDGMLISLDEMLVNTDKSGKAVILASNNSPLFIVTEVNGLEQEIVVDPSKNKNVTINMSKPSGQILCNYFVNMPGVINGQSMSPVSHEFGHNLQIISSKTGEQVGFQIRNGTIYLDESSDSVKPGQTIIITIGMGSRFTKDASIPVKLDDNCNGVADIYMTVRGAIAIFPKRSDGSTRIFATLFNKDGDIVQSINGDLTYITFESIEKGDYTVALSGVSQPQSDCLETPREDVILIKASIKDGQTTALRDVIIPKSREFTSAIEANFSLRSLEDINNLSLRVNTQDGVKLLQYIIEIPAHTELVRDSVRDRDWTLLSERVENTNLPHPDTLIFDASRTNTVNFSVKTLSGLNYGIIDGQMISRAWVVYNYNGVQIREELPSLQIKREYLTLHAPKKTESDKITIRGEGPSLSNISIFCNDEWVTTVQTSKDGLYSTTLELEDDGAYELYSLTFYNDKVISSEVHSLRKGIIEGESWVESIHISDNRNNSCTINGISDSYSMVQLFLTPDSIHTFRIKFGGNVSGVHGVEAKFLDGDRVTHLIPLMYDESSGDWVAKVNIDACHVSDDDKLGSKLVVSFGAKQPYGDTMEYAYSDMSTLFRNHYASLDIPRFLASEVDALSEDSDIMEISASSILNSLKAALNSLKRLDPYLPEVVQLENLIGLIEDFLKEYDQYDGMKQMLKPIIYPCLAFGGSQEGLLRATTLAGQMKPLASVLFDIKIGDIVGLITSIVGGLTNLLGNLSTFLLNSLQILRKENSDIKKVNREFLSILSRIKCYRCDCNQKGEGNCACMPGVSYCGLEDCTCSEPPEGSTFEYPKCECTLADIEAGVCGVICPAGFVFEAVYSNVLEDVASTIICIDDPSKLSLIPQDITQYTGNNGAFEWDVPEGLWQIIFEKEGYFTTESEVLVVPPEHKNIPIMMVSKELPGIESIEFDGNSALIRFTQYMEIASLQDCISLDGLNFNSYEIITLDAEVSASNPFVMLARTIKIDFSQPLSDSVILNITNLPSYTGNLLNYFIVLQ